MFAALSIQREPPENLSLLRGVLIGAVMVHAAGPLLAGDRAALGRELGRFVISVVATAVTIYPRALLLPLIPFEIFIPLLGVLAFVVAAGFIVTIVEIARTLRRLALAIFATVDRSSAVRSIACAALGTAVASAALASTDRWQWSDPPLSLPASVVGVTALLVLAVASLRTVLEPTEPNGADTYTMKPPPFALGLTVVAVLLWGGLADRAFPYGLWPATLTVISSDPGDRALVNGYLREAETRTGLRGSSERFIVRIGPNLVPAPRESVYEFLPNGAIELRLNTGLPADRVHNYLTVQFARILAGMRLSTVDPALLDGFAYWASENTHNPFYAGSIGQTSARAACAALPGVSFYDRTPFFYLADASVPFVRAELTGGVQAAHQRMGEFLDANAGPDELHAAASGDCPWYLEKFPPPKELFVEAPQNMPQLADESYVRAAFDLVARRSGLDAMGSTIRVRYMPTLPAGRLVDFAQEGQQQILLINSGLSESRRATFLKWGLAVIFIGTRYGPAPIGRGFAEWVAEDPTNPFLSDPARAKSLCQGPTLQNDLKWSSNDGIYLASLPFIQADRTGGGDAARALFVSAMQRSAAEDAWRGRIGNTCRAL